MINKRLVHMAKGSMAKVWQNVTIQWLGLCCNIATILSIGWLLSRVLEGQYSASDAVAVGAVALFAIVARFACAVVSSNLSHSASEGVKLMLRSKIYSKLLLLGPSYPQQISTSEAVQVAVEGVDQLENYFGKYLPQLFYSLLAPLTLFVVLAFISLPAAMVLLLCVPLIPVSIILVQKFAKKLLAKYWGKYTSLGNSFLENLQGLTTLKIYQSDAAKNKEMNAQAEDFRRITMRVLVMQLNSITLMDVIAYGGAALGIFISVSQFLQGNIGFFGCFCIILLGADFFIPLRLLGSFFHIAMNGTAASEKIFNLLDTPTTEAKFGPQPNMDIGITTNALSYSYDSTRPVLQNVHLQARQGITAIVGESGCGKSTLAGVLSGQNRHFTGDVSFGGVPLADIDTDTLSKTVTVVPHNSYLFKGTVRSNLLMADPSATDEELWEALRQSNIKDFLAAEQGLDTPVASQGTNLSGGQRQRLALARALLHNTPVYIFDEASSNVDVESESDISAAIWEMGKTKTILLISHRLANVVPAHQIYVLKQGRVVEEGTHQALLTQNGSYAHMYHSQQKLENHTKKEVAHG